MSEYGVYGVVAYGGADPRGARDSTREINRTATDAAARGGLLFFEPGTYLIRDTVVVTSDCDGTSATLSYTGSGLALQAGAGTSRTLLLGRSLRLPRVEYANKPARGWDARTIGIEVFNGSACELMVPSVTGFETGLLMYGYGAGSAYNVTALLDIRNNKVNVKLDADSTGWCNQNLFLGGHLSHASGEGRLVSGTRHVLLASTTNTINTNTFVGTSLESAEIVEYMLDVDEGFWNTFDACRWEDTSGSGRVRWGAGAQENTIRGGSYANLLTQTKVADQVRNQIFTSNLIERQGSNATALERRENLNSSAHSVLEVYTAGTMSGAYTAGTDYSFALSALALKAKVKTDTEERVRIESSSGRIYIGPGGASAAVGYLEGTASLMLVGAVHLGMVDDGRFDVGLASSNRPRNIYATGKLTLGSTQVLTGAGTPERAVTAPVGSMFLRTDGGAGTTLYVKESGTGNTGWAAK
jgi:hypothetical protein